MTWQVTAYTMLLLAGAIGSSVGALFAWRRIHVPGSGWAAILLLACTEWMIADALRVASFDLPAKVFWIRWEFLGIAIVPTALLVFCLKYTDHTKWLTKSNLVLLSIEPAAIQFLAWTNEHHHLIWAENPIGSGSAFPSLINGYGPAFWADVVYAYALLLLATLLLMQVVVRPRQVNGRRISFLLFAVLAPWLGNAIYVLGPNLFSAFDLTPFTTTVCGLALVVGIATPDRKDITSMARRAVAQNVGDGMVVLDAEDRILDMNQAARQLLGQDTVVAAGEPLGRVWPLWTSTKAPHLDDVPEADREIVVDSGEGHSTFDMRVSSVTDRRGCIVSRIVIIRKIA